MKEVGVLFKCESTIYIHAYNNKFGKKRKQNLKCRP